MTTGKRMKYVTGLPELHMYLDSTDKVMKPPRSLAVHLQIHFPHLPTYLFHYISDIMLQRANLRVPLALRETRRAIQTFIPELKTITFSQLEENLSFYQDLFKRIAYDESVLLRLLRGKEKYDICFSLVYLLLKEGNFDLIEDIVTTLVYYSEKEGFEIRMIFVHSLLLHFLEVQTIEKFYYFQKMFGKRADFKDALFAMIESFFTEQSVEVWYYLQVLFKSFIGVINMNTDQEEK